MKGIHRVWRLIVVLTLAGVLFGCTSQTPTAAPTTAPTTAPTVVPPTLAPTVDLQPTLNAVKTQSAATVIANLTQSAPAATATTAATATKPAATATAAVPTNTTAPKATSTSTLPPVLTAWTLVPTKAAYNCAVVDYSPKASTSIATSADFDVKWVVTNTGSMKWMPTETMFRYVDGVKMQKYGDYFPVTSEVAPGGSYTIGVDMLAPATAGTYHMSWKLTYGSVTVCSFAVNVVVK
jgi:hypothetical protein